MSRAAKSEKTYPAAVELAGHYRMVLSNPSDGCYQLRHVDLGWIINLYPRRNGASPRAYSDPHHRGPFLNLPQLWTLLDAVEAAVDAAPLQPAAKAESGQV
jgi:hypothetical protein